jgi:hypothetical protein
MLHRAALKASDIETLRGFKVTRPLPTILTLAREATIALQRQLPWTCSNRHWLKVADAGSIG